MSPRLLRIQNADGIGPFVSGAEMRPRWHRPKRSKRDADRWVKVLDRRDQADDPVHLAFAVKGAESLHFWFTEHDVEQLAGMGFALVDVSACHVMLDFEYEVVVASRLPFSAYAAAPRIGTFLAHPKGLGCAAARGFASS